jgi:hypothetical protein
VDALLSLEDFHPFYSVFGRIALSCVAHEEKRDLVGTLHIRDRTSKCLILIYLRSTTSG